jgi:hypothetical protein
MMVYACNLPRDVPVIYLESLLLHLELIEKYHSLPQFLLTGTSYSLFGLAPPQLPLPRRKLLS